jgi:hypothetical protein
MRRTSGWTTLILLLGGVAGPLAAQESPPLGEFLAGGFGFPPVDEAPAARAAGPLAVWLSPGLLPPRLWGEATPAAQLPCPQCTPPKRPGRAAMELVLVQLIPWSVNRFVKDAEWANVSPSTWAQNFENPWKWDNNAFLGNQFSHPYHGSLYFNTARSNGYNFWQSVPWAWGGSLMWELMGESWAPSPNDLLNTSLGGITLGEMLFRASSLALDNTATGAERTFREIGATLLDPVRGFNRILDGQMNDVTANPADWRPSKNRASFDIGFRHTSGHIEDQPNQSADQWFFQMDLDYGDSVDDLGKAPFSFMEVTVGIAEKIGDTRNLQDLRARGSLGAKTLSQSENAVHRLAGYMTYTYYGQPSLEFGAQGFQGGLVSRWGKKDGVRLHTELLAVGQPVAALKSDYFLSVEGRDYDYGVSLGSQALARLTKQGLGFIEANGLWLWTPILSGFNGSHTQLAASLEAKIYPLANRLGVGGSVTWYHRTSDYDLLADVKRSGVQSRLFLALSVPRWN